MKLEWRRWPPGASGSGQRELVGFRDKVSEVVQTQSRDVRGYRLRSSNEGGVDDGFVLGRRFKAIDSAIEDISEQLAVLEIPAEEAPADAIPESIGGGKNAEWFDGLTKPVEPVPYRHGSGSWRIGQKRCRIR